jgi:dCTP deaminase
MMLAELVAIDPYDDERLNPNSYNVRLHRALRVYTNKKKGWGMAGWHPSHRANPVLDIKEDNQSEEFEIPKEGFVLQPGVLYLGRTIEHTTTKYPLVPMLEGRTLLVLAMLDILGRGL